LQIILELAAHPEPVVRGHRHVARIEEPVDVRAEEQPVVQPVLTALLDRPDVGRVESRQRLLAGDRLQHSQSRGTSIHSDSSKKNGCESKMHPIR